MFYSVIWMGLQGHRIVAEVANRHLTQDTKESIKNILGHSNLAQNSNDPDIIFRAQSPKTSKWHYFNGAKIDHSQDKPTSSSNVLTAYQKQLSILKNPHLKKKDRKKALSWVVHLVADAHQPFPCGVP